MTRGGAPAATGDAALAVRALDETRDESQDEALSVPAAFRSGSRAGAIWLAFAREARLRGRAVTLAEGRERFLADGHPASAAFTAEVGSLRRRGYLAAEGGGIPLRYWAVDPARPCARVGAGSAPELSEESRAPLGDGERVHRALGAACAASGHMVSTRAVADSLALLGWRLDSGDPNAVRSRLMVMARPVTSRRRATWGPKLVRHVVVPGADGRGRSFWAPADAGHLVPPAEGLTSQMDAADHVVRAATAALGRPATRSELVAFLGTVPEADTSRRLLTTGDNKPRLARLLRGARRAGGPRVYVLETEPGAPGGVPTRYWPQGLDLTARAQLAMLLDDWCTVHRPVAEIEGIVRLLRQTTGADAQVLAPILRARVGTARVAAALLASRVAAAGGSLEEAVAAAVAAHLTVVGWLGRRASGRPQLHQAVVERRARVAMLRRVPWALRWLDAEGRALRGADRLSLAPCTVTLAELTPWVEVYVDPDLGPKGIAKAFDGCRRSRNWLLDREARFAPAREASGAGARADGAPAPERAREVVPLARLDRPEALATAVGLQDDAWTRVTVAKARNLLGEIMRDSEAVDWSLDLAWGTPAISASIRRQLVVAAGLLATPQAEEHARRLLGAAGAAGGEDADTRAALLALALMHGPAVGDVIDALTRERWPASVERRLRRARGPASRGLVLSVAAGR